MRTRTGAVLLVLLASACGGSSESGPRVLPSVSVSPSASASASAVPTGINAPTAQGAADFVRFFYAEITRAFAERDPSAVQRLSADSCDTCRQYVTSLTKLRDNDERVVGFNIVLSAVVAPALESTGSARVDAIWSYEGGKRLDRNGKVIREERPTSGIEETVELQRVDGAWRVAEVTRVRVRG